MRSILILLKQVISGCIFRLNKKRKIERSAKLLLLILSAELKKEKKMLHSMVCGRMKTLNLLKQIIFLKCQNLM
uniref:Uncharacterized protein n=1 Tax=Siphoviridae sp. ctxMM9 TaxID=2827973 RepID=A0A8S5T6Y3_9CAUD|nr:MAG TPA: hypothetical protein [Siphoviridae sp. ctxMM9]